MILDTRRVFFVLLPLSMFVASLFVLCGRAIAAREPLWRSSTLLSLFAVHLATTLPYAAYGLYFYQPWTMAYVTNLSALPPLQRLSLAIIPGLTSVVTYGLLVRQAQHLWRLWITLVVFSGLTAGCIYVLLPRLLTVGPSFTAPVRFALHKTTMGYTTAASLMALFVSCALSLWRLRQVNRAAKRAPMPMSEPVEKTQPPKDKRPKS